LHKLQRQKVLIDLLSENNVMSIAELSQQLNFSMMTIRRDLEYFELKGIVKRMHGGALLLRSDTGQPSFYERIEEFDEEKSRIGQAAAKMIKPGSIVYLDAGTTSLAMVQHIPDDLEFTAITTGLMTAVALCGKPRAEVISIGGSIHQSSFSAINYLAVENIKRFSSDIAFISTKAVGITEGTFEAQLSLIEVKRAIVGMSSKVVLLVDLSKFESKSLCMSVPMKDIDTIITDRRLPQQTADTLKAWDLELLLV